MSRFFISNGQVENNQIKIIGEDVNHIANVLRKQVGDTLNICNMSTSEDFLCKIEEINKEQIYCSIINRIESNTESNTKITIFQGLPKAEKMELIIQKCTELGAYNFFPVIMERCVVKYDNKTENKKIDRWQKIAETAAKQSGRNIIPKVENLINLKKVCNLIKKYDIVLLAYENEKKYTLKKALKMLQNRKDLNIGIIIGPEGGISENEVQTLIDAGAQVITLGNRILRTETVGISMTSIILYEMD